MFEYAFFAHIRLKNFIEKILDIYAMYKTRKGVTRE